MDSRVQTFEHIQKVQDFMLQVVRNLLERQENHDQSKLKSPEVELFDSYTSELAKTTYGSEKYKNFLEALKPALDHHYANNSHHPEHFKNGIQDMSLLDLIEMLMDWKAASLRHNDGNILKSIDKNQERFGYSNELKQIFLNTIKELRIT